MEKETQLPKLTPKQQRFCEEYIKTGNASEAYRIAYPTSVNWKPDTVKVNASKLLSDTNISLTVKAMQKEATKKFNITKDFIVNELLWVIENAKYQEKIDFNAINKASDTLNKMFGHNAPDKVEHSGSLDINGLTERLIGKQ